MVAGFHARTRHLHLYVGTKFVTRFPKFASQACTPLARSRVLLRGRACLCRGAASRVESNRVESSISSSLDPRSSCTLRRRCDCTLAKRVDVRVRHYKRRGAAYGGVGQRETTDCFLRDTDKFAGPLDRNVRKNVNVTTDECAMERWSDGATRKSSDRKRNVEGCSFFISRCTGARENRRHAHTLFFSDQVIRVRVDRPRRLNT